MQRRFRAPLNLLALAAILALAGVQAHGTVYSITANAGDNENPPTGSPGIATANFTVDDVTNVVTWDVTYSGVLYTPTASHIHLGGPTVNGGVIMGMGTPTGGHYSGSATVSATVRNQILTQPCYYNLHTNFYPAGEIRGQLGQPAVPNDETHWGAVKALYAQP